VSGVPPNFELLPFLLMFYYIKCRKIVIFNQLGVQQNFFKALEGAANQKGLRNTGLGGRMCYRVYLKLTSFFLEQLQRCPRAENPNGLSPFSLESQIA
jgi:hypothetical protein